MHGPGLFPPAARAGHRSLRPGCRGRCRSDCRCLGEKRRKRSSPRRCQRHRAGECLLYHADGWLLGSATAKAEAGRNLNEVAQNCYCAILRAARGAICAASGITCRASTRPTPDFRTDTTRSVTDARWRLRGSLVTRSRAGCRGLGGGHGQRPPVRGIRRLRPGAAPLRESSPDTGLQVSAHVWTPHPELCPRHRCIGRKTV